MAIQMDVKEKAGFSGELLSGALEQARVARLHILGEMNKVMSEPRRELSDNAPRVFTFKIDIDRIGGVIGPAGKNIKEIIAVTGTQVDIEDDGSVMVYAKDVETAQMAVKWIKILAGEVEVGSVFQGKVKKVMDFGVFVELVPGKDGLIHISNVARSKQRDLDRICPPGTVLKVKVISCDKDNDRIGLESSELKRD